MATISLRSACPHNASVTSTCIKVRLIVRNVDSVACYCLPDDATREISRDREPPSE